MSLIKFIRWVSVIVLALVAAAVILVGITGNMQNGKARAATAMPAANKNAVSAVCVRDVYGVVLTSDGFGVADAAITVTDSAGTVHTGASDDDDGYFDIVGLANGAAKVTMTPQTGMGPVMSGTVNIPNCGGAEQDFTLAILGVTPTPAQ